MADTASNFPILAECHCGTVKIGAPLPDEPLNACSCTVCTRYGAVWAYYLLEQVRFAIKVDDGTPRGAAHSDTKDGHTNEAPDDAKKQPEATEHIIKTSVKAPTETFTYSHGKMNCDFHACPRCFMLMFTWPLKGHPQMGLNSTMVLNRKEAFAGIETVDVYELEGRPD